jgi:hypothetical protein
LRMRATERVAPAGRFAWAAEAGSEFDAGWPAGAFVKLVGSSIVSYSNFCPPAADRLAVPT